jgi:hypothetical protein
VGSPALFFEELYLKQFGWILAILGLLGCILAVQLRASERLLVATLKK